MNESSAYLINQNPVNRWKINKTNRANSKGRSPNAPASRIKCSVIRTAVRNKLNNAARTQANPVRANRTGIRVAASNRANPSAMKVVCSRKNANRMLTVVCAIRIVTNAKSSDPP